MSAFAPVPPEEYRLLWEVVAAAMPLVAQLDRLDAWSARMAEAGGELAVRASVVDEPWSPLVRPLRDALAALAAPVRAEEAST